VNGYPRWDTYGESAKADLSNLILLGIERIHPITLAVARAMKRPEEVRKSLYYLVAASVRLLIAAPAPGGQFEKSVAEVAPRVTDGTIATAKDLAAAMNETIVPGDADFEEAFSTASVSQAHLARYYLRALNQGYDTRESHPARVGNQSKGNVEHILPQSRSAAWGHIKEDVAKTFCKRIGNLTLLLPKENVDSGNKDFLTVKVPIFKNSPFVIAQDVADYAAWDQATIEQRQRRLATLAVKVWTAKVK